MQQSNVSLNTESTSAGGFRHCFLGAVASSAGDTVAAGRFKALFGGIVGSGFFVFALELVASLLLVVRPGAPSSFLLLVAMPGAPSSVLVPVMSLINIWIS